MERLSILHWAIVVAVVGIAVLSIATTNSQSESQGRSMNIPLASRYHRLLIVSFLAFLITAFGLKGTPELQLIAFFTLWIFNIFCCFNLASAIGRPAIIWALVGALGFLILWIPQLLLVNAANKAFKSEGLKVGFLGGATRPL